MSDPIQRAQDQVAYMYFHYGPNSAQWRALVALLNEWAGGIGGGISSLPVPPGPFV